MPTFEEQHTLTLRIGGRDYPIWQTVDVSYGIETGARDFAIESTRDAEKVSQGEIYLGDACEIFIGPPQRKRKVLTGYVDGINPSYDPAGSRITINGRSRTGDLIDSCHVGKRRFNRQSVGAILLEMLDPHGISATVDGDIGELVDRFSIDVGDKVFDAIESLTERFGFLVYDDADGDLVLQRAVDGSFSASPNDVLRRGVNIKSAEGTFDASQVYSTYRCKGQAVGTDEGFGDLAAGIEALERTTAIGRARVLVMTGEGSSTARCKARAQWEAATRIGRASSVSYTLCGWYRSDGNLWQPGTTVEVDDPFMRVSGRLLITNVGLHKSSEDGTTAELTLGPEYGYYARLPEKTKRSIGAWRSPV